LPLEAGREKPVICAEIRHAAFDQTGLQTALQQELLGVVVINAEAIANEVAQLPKLGIADGDEQELNFRHVRASGKAQRLSVEIQAIEHRAFVVFSLENIGKSGSLRQLIEKQRVT